MRFKLAVTINRHCTAPRFAVPFGARNKTPNFHQVFRPIAAYVVVVDRNGNSVRLDTVSTQSPALPAVCTENLIRID